MNGYCKSCSLECDQMHESKDECIDALMAAMRKQRRAAESLAFDISTRYLAVLEELTLRPDAGVRYLTKLQGEDEPRVLHAQQVSGVFSSILRRYEEMGEWSPLRQAQKYEDLWRLSKEILCKFIEGDGIEHEDVKKLLSFAEDLLR